jgi:general secretion pathway protein G
MREARQMKSSGRLRAAAGMTLVEILVVIIIIGILASITFVAVDGIRRRVSKEHTENVIRKLADALEQYKTRAGAYPTGSRADIYASLKALKLVDPFGAAKAKTGAQITQEGGRTVICDYWRTPLRFAVPGAHSAPAPDIWSWGPDRAGSENPSDTSANTQDDIRNWEMR